MVSFIPDQYIRSAMLQVAQHRSELLQLVASSIADAIAYLKDQLSAHSPKFTAVVSLEGRLNAVNKERLYGTISDSDLQIEYNKIRKGLIEMADQLEPADFQSTEPTSKSKSGKQQGHVLYRIPNTMKVGVESKCVIRLALEVEDIIKNIELDQNVHLKDIRVSDIMMVELLDPSAHTPFEVRSLNSLEQFIEPNEYTEWIFMVRPLLEGRYPLMIKISIIELIYGKERKREIVLEEFIEIVTEIEQLQGEPEYKASGHTLQLGNSEPVPKAKAPAAKSTSSRLNRSLIARSLALLIFMYSSFWTYAYPEKRDWLWATIRHSSETYGTFADNYLLSQHREEAVWRKAVIEDRPPGFNEYLSEYPIGQHRQEAFGILERLETRQMQLIERHNKVEDIRDYLSWFPQGKWVKEVIRRAIQHQLQLEGISTDLDALSPGERERLFWNFVQQNPTPFLQRVFCDEFSASEIPEALSACLQLDQQYRQEKQQGEKALWQLVLQEPTPEHYLRYLERFPDGAHIEATKTFLAAAGIPLPQAFTDFETEQRDWTDVRTRNSVEAYQVYVGKYPKGKYIREARRYLQEQEANASGLEDTTPPFNAQTTTQTDKPADLPQSPTDDPVVEKNIPESPIPAPTKTDTDPGEITSDLSPAVEHTSESERPKVQTSPTPSAPLPAPATTDTSNLDKEENSSLRQGIKGIDETALPAGKEETEYNQNGVEFGNYPMYPIRSGNIEESTLIRDEEQWRIPAFPDSLHHVRQYLRSFPEGKFQQQAEHYFQKTDLTQWNKAQAAGTPEAYFAYYELLPDGQFAKRAVTLSDRLIWEQTTEAGTVDAYDHYLATLPKGRYVGKALRRTNKLLWRSARKTRTSAAYRAYLEHYGSGLRARKARERAHTLSWKEAVLSGDVFGYNTYLDWYPKGEYAEQAKTEIDKLAWYRIDEQRTLEGYEGYLNKYGKGRFRAIARQKIDTLSWELAEKIDSLEAYRQYLRRNPSGQFRGQALSRSDQLFWSQVLAEDTITAFEQYLREFQKGQFREQASRRVDAWKWEQTEAKGTAYAYRQYLRDVPYGKFRDLAKDRMDELSWQRADSLGTADAYSRYLAEVENGRFARRARALEDSLSWAAALQTGTVQALGAYIKNPENSLQRQHSATADNLSWNITTEAGNREAYLTYASVVANGTYRDTALRIVEEMKWDEVQQAGSIDDYQDYLGEYAEGKYAGEAEEKIQNLTWAAALLARNTSAIDSYLREYPHGRYLDAAMAVRDTVKWEEAQRANTRQAVVSYLRDYPTGDFALQAEEQMEEFTWQEAVRGEDYKKYLRFYPDGQYAESARRAIENIAWGKAEKDHTYNSYRDFIATFPDGEHLKEANEVRRKLFLQAFPLSDATDKARFVSNFRRHMEGDDYHLRISDLAYSSRVRASDFAIADPLYWTNVNHNQIWLAQNINSRAISNKSIPDFLNFGGDRYTWKEAVDQCASLGDKWRLANQEEWEILIEAYGDYLEIDDQQRLGNKKQERVESAYQELSIGGKSHFGFQPGLYWSASDASDNDQVQTYTFDENNRRIIRSNTKKSEKAYCRCVRDR